MKWHVINFAFVCVLCDYNSVHLSNHVYLINKFLPLSMLQFRKSSWIILVFLLILFFLCRHSIHKFPIFYRNVHALTVSQYICLIQHGLTTQSFTYHWSDCSGGWAIIFILQQHLSLTIAIFAIDINKYQELVNYSSYLRYKKRDLWPH